MVIRLIAMRNVRTDGRTDGQTGIEEPTRKGTKTSHGRTQLRTDWSNPKTTQKLDGPNRGDWTDQTEETGRA